MLSEDRHREIELLWEFQSAGRCPTTADAIEDLLAEVDRTAAFDDLLAACKAAQDFLLDMETAARDDRHFCEIVALQKGIDDAIAKAEAAQARQGS